MKRSMFTWVAVGVAVFSLFGLALATGASAQGGDDPAQIEAGQAVFELNCAGCHGSDGAGTSQGRPLIGVAVEQPDRSVHVMSVTDGRTVMPAFGERLSAEEIDAAVSYVRLTFVDPDAEPAALADTGTETGLLAVGGLTMVATGALLAHHARGLRRD